MRAPEGLRDSPGRVSSLSPGEILDGRFVVEQAVGKGGMGTVFRAVDRATGETIALKVLRHREGDARRFEREARVLAELAHDAIVRYVAHGVTSAGDPWLAMEWLPGQDLAEWLSSHALTPREALRLGSRVAAALSAAHSLGIVHRDIKPANLLLPGGDPARVKVVDFGIARRTDRATQVVTGTGVLVGTPGYLAPEQARGEKGVDGRADLYSLGCVLFECLTGKPAFRGDNFMALLARILLEDPPRLSDHRPDAPQGLDALLASLLAKDPARRPPDAAGLVATLDALAAECEGADVAVAWSAPPPAALSGGERRVVCAVLAVHPLASPSPSPRSSASLDEAASETLAAGADLPRDLADLCARFLGAEGRMDRMADGGVVFAVNGATTDEASRAARLALALRERLPDRVVAVAAGQALTAAHAPLGSVLERAASLAQSGCVGGVVVDAVAASLLHDRFRLQAGEGGATLLGERDDDDEVRPLLGVRTPCVGRERELALLGATVTESADDGVVRAVVVTAPAGAGKSRLRREFLGAIGARDEVPVVWTCRSDVLAVDSPLATLGAMVRRAAGVEAGATSVRGRETLRAFAKGLGVAEPERVATFLGELCGLAFDATGDAALLSARGDPKVMADHTRRAFVDALAGACTKGPLVLVLDDAHWSDSASLALLDGALRALRDRALTVIAFARPELLERYPRLWAEHTLQELRLTPLSRRSCERIAQRVLGDAVSADTVAQLIERAGGNAFYLEELLRSVAAGAAELPDTVLAGVQGRLASLSPDARRVLRAASVFGESCWPGGVGTLLAERDHTSAVRAVLDELCAQEVLARASSSRFRGEAEYRFHHALVREAAYAMLTAEDRALGHRLAAEWLEGAGESDPLVLASHWERGGLPNRAARCLVDAAEAALAVVNGEAVLAHAERAERLLGSEADEALRGSLLRLRAEGSALRGSYGDAVRSGLEAMERLPPDAADWSLAAICATTATARSGDQASLAVVERRLAAATACEDAPHPLVDRARACLAFELYLSGSIDRGDAQIAALGRPFAWLLENDPLTAGFARMASAARAVSTEDLSLHVREATAALDIARRANNRLFAAHCSATAAGSLAMLGQSERTERFVADCLALCDEIGAAPQRARGLMARAAPDERGSLRRSRDRRPRGQRAPQPLRRASPPRLRAAAPRALPHRRRSARRGRAPPRFARRPAPGHPAREPRAAPATAGPPGGGRRRRALGAARAQVPRDDGPLLRAGHPVRRVAGRRGPHGRAGGARTGPGGGRPRGRPGARRRGPPYARHPRARVRARDVPHPWLNHERRLLRRQLQPAAHLPRAHRLVRARDPPRRPGARGPLLRPPARQGARALHPPPRDVRAGLRPPARRGDLLHRAGDGRDVAHALHAPGAEGRASRLVAPAHHRRRHPQRDRPLARVGRGRRPRASVGARAPRSPAPRRAAARGARGVVDRGAGTPREGRRRVRPRADGRHLLRPRARAVRPPVTAPWQVLGLGRMGRAFVALASRHAHRVAGAASRGAASRAFDEPTVWLLAVSDGAIAATARHVAAQLRAGDVVLHLAGARGLDVLSEARTAGAAVGALHPLAAVSTLDPPGDLSGAAFLVEGEPAAVEAARHVASLAGGRLLVADAVDRARYHAGAALVASGAVAIAQGASWLFASAVAPTPAEEGLRAAVASLLVSVSRNVLHLGADAALASPLLRNDVETLARHLDAMAADPTVRALYQAVLARVLVPLEGDPRVRPETVVAARALAKAPPDPH